MSVLNDFWQSVHTIVNNTGTTATAKEAPAELTVNAAVPTSMLFPGSELLQAMQTRVLVG